MPFERLAIIDGARTPFCKSGTELAAFGADELGRAAASAVLARTGLDPELISEVIFGCVAQPLDAGNISRVIALRSGIPRHVPALTVHRNCASGFEAVTQAWEKLNTGRGSIFLVGGTESMSQIPLLHSYQTALKFGQWARAKSRWDKIKALGAFRLSDFKPRIGLRLGLMDPVCGMNMGQTAELIGREAGITRELQDAFALDSHRKAIAAQTRLAEEIAPFYAPPDFNRIVQSDNGPRKGQTLEALAKLPPVFEPVTGAVTAGNSSQVTDGAVAMLVMGEQQAERLNLKPLGFLTGYATAACDPCRMGLGPVYAMARAEKETGLKLGDADLVEINEAFAVQVLACVSRAQSTDFAKTELDRDRALGAINPDLLNVNGGAIALGHPVGASGARLILTALLELRRRKKKRALVSACVGGGQGAALWLEAVP